MKSEIGFVGLGVMGQPMAMNLLRAGTRLVVWNRTPERCEPLNAAGATIAPTVADAFDRTEVVVLMLFDSAAIDSVLCRDTPKFAQLVEGHTIVNASSVSPQYSRGLATDIELAGGRYVEAPVSGSRIPAENAKLVVMLAGEQQVVEDVKPILKPMCREMVECGPVGSALLMKLSVNLFLIVTLTGLSEAVHFAAKQGLNLERLKAVLNASQLASDVSRIKIDKLINRDFGAQAALGDALNSANLILQAAKEARISASLIERCRDLYTETIAAGYENEDMVSVIRAIETHTAQLSQDI